ncbi:MAG TPA: nucleotide pyrophosphatase/phosphodiesterase family protein [Chloroflexota bacterium]
MHRTVVLNVVGLTPGLLGEHTPRLQQFVASGQVASITPVLPAVTCTVQASFLTGTYPAEHGIVGNGWYFRDELEVKFWRQSNRLVQAPKIWERARAEDPSFTCANVCWWFNMYSSVNWAVTPRPMYPSDGRKLPDVWTQPGDLRDALQAELGQFPLFKFWGPATDISATRWIAEAAKWIERRHQPTLSLVYLPHLDYVLQRLGPGHPGVANDLSEIDAVFGDLLDSFSGQGVRVVLVSEYGIRAVSRPVHLNRRFREAGLIATREELGRDMVDVGASVAFAAADHQVAHVYVNDLRRVDEVRRIVEQTPGVAEVLDEPGKRANHIDHPRAGELVAVAEPDAWFTYYYWLDDARAPDYARTVDIHRKPGYDPVELFIDPAIRAPKVKVGLTLLRRQLGFRSLMEVTPLDATLVRGSHGRVITSPDASPIIATQVPDVLPGEQLQAPQVFDVLLQHLGAGAPALTRG